MLNVGILMSNMFSILLLLFGTLLDAHVHANLIIINNNNIGRNGSCLKCYYRPTASLQLNNKGNTKYNITVT